MLRLLSFASILCCAVCCAACDVEPRALVDVDAGAPVPVAASPPDHAPVATALGDALAAAGLDLLHLPPLDALDGRARDAVMDAFDRALGARCSDCHADDPRDDTPRLRIARKMWDRFVGGLRLRGGGALFCDSCHQGAITFLDRSDARVDGALGRWMQASYVDGLSRSDGAPHGCATCHGDPFVGGFLDDWAAGDGAPDDGGSAPSDLGAPDLGAPDLGVVGCEALLVCLDACAHDDGACSRRCKLHASAAAKALLAAAEQCADDDCVRLGRCKSASDDSADCNACFSNASSGGATGVACVPADDPACGDCAGAWLACETN